MKELTIKVLDVDPKYADILHDHCVHSENCIGDTILPIDEVLGRLIHRNHLYELGEVIRYIKSINLEDNLFIRI